jgi:hypothetical protein
MNLSSKTVLTFALFLASWAAAQSPRSSHDPAPRKPQKHYDSFVDFALKQINPQDIDYGQRIEEARQSFIDDSILSLEFWGNTLPVIVLLIAFGMFVRQDNERKRREILVAEVLAWYHNGLVDAHQEHSGLLTKYRQLKKIYDDQREAKLAEGAQPVGSDSLPPGTGKKESRGSGQPAQPPASGTKPQPPSEVESLRIQVSELTNANKSLRQQISTVGHRLQEEVQKNRTLKGE